MRELLEDLARLEAGGRVGRAVVIRVEGSAPRLPGATLLVRQDGAMAGSVSGGCVESAVVAQVLQSIESGRPQVVSHGVSNELAWTVGLACGGTIHLLIQPEVPVPVREAAAKASGSVVATLLEEPDAGARAWTIPEEEPAQVPQGGSDFTTRLEALARTSLRTGTSAVEQVEGLDRQESVFLEVFPRQSRLVLVGGGHVSAHLAAMAKRLGYYVVVTDSRAAFLDRARFPDVDALVTGWPDETLPRIGLDSATSVAVLSHDPRLDEPALAIALRSPARYVGAIGSRKTQEGRRARLLQLGVPADQVERLHGPIGLDLGGREPAEIALAILAEMTQTRYGKRRG